MSNNLNPVKKVSQRMPALDLARIFAMLMMIQGHTLFEMASPAHLNTSEFPWNIWLFFRGLTAPIFLMVSGIVNVFANKRDENGNLSSKTVWRRIRIALSITVLGYMFLFPADKIYHIFFIQFSFWQPFLQVNTLQLIGVTLLMILLLFRFTKSDRSLGIASFIIACSIIMLTPFVQMVKWFNILPEFAAAYMSYDHGSIFTIFPFSAFMFFGVAVGTVLKQVPQEKRYSYLMKFGLPLGLAVIGGGYLLYQLFQVLPFNFADPLKANPGMSIIRIGCVFVVLAGVTFVFTKTSKLAPVYSLFGKRALFVYVAHLILLYGMPWMPSIAKIYHYALTPGYAIMVAVLVQIASMSLAYFYETSLHKYPEAKAYYRYSLATFIIFILFV